MRKRKRRVELHIERHEISVYAGAGASHRRDFGMQAPEVESIGVARAQDSACPTCGASGLVQLADAVAQAGQDLTQFNVRMQDGSIHYHRSASGQWRVCARSLRQS